MRLLSFDAPKLPTASQMSSLLWSVWDGCTEIKPDTVAQRDALRNILVKLFPQLVKTQNDDALMRLPIWTSSMVQGDNALAWCVDAYRGTYSLETRDQKFPLLLISQPMPELDGQTWREEREPAALRYIPSITEPDTFIDRKTGYHWSAPCPSRTVTWAQAVTEYLGPDIWP